MRTALWLSVTVAAAGLLSGACSSISGMGGIHLAAADLSAQAKSRRPDPQKALIYVYRNESMAVACIFGHNPLLSLFSLPQRGLNF